MVSAATGKQERNGEMQEFQGGFKQGMIEGFGQVTIEGKVTYSGQWRNGKPHGNGQATYIELNTTYTGGWVDGLWQGEGSLVHSSKFLAVHDNSKSYTIKGHFVKGNLDGEGSRTYASGKTIKGNWFDNELMTGKLYNVDGTTYEGEWLGGRPHGIGTKTISGGKRYEGMFFLGRPWGIGSKIDSSENREDGFWDGSKFIPGQVTEEQETEFKKQLKHATTYYHIFKKHYLTDLPKTNYDLVKEEH